MRLFFSGIGGSGVSAIAGFQAEKGDEVIGSDRLFDRQPGHPLRCRLERSGIAIVPQDGSGIDASVNLAVFSTAVESSNPEVLRVNELSIPHTTRPDYLAAIVGRYRTIAVAGTSGKSTTAGMLAFLMEELGMAPNYIGGGRVAQFRNEASAGNYRAGESNLLVVEACESDGTIVRYRPSLSIIANLDLDHHAISETARMFEALSGQTAERVLANADDPYLRSCGIRNSRWYSFRMPSEYQAEELESGPFSGGFRLRGREFRVNLPGRHNRYNALACVALLDELGVPLDAIARVLPEFRGIERRFEVHLRRDNRFVIDDYAHNPHKIEALMDAMNGISDRICYVFQPHGFGPTKLMKAGYIDTFIRCLRPVDRLLLLPIYFAGGSTEQDISSEEIVRPVRDAGFDAECVSRDNIKQRIAPYTSVVVFGARDDSLSDLARTIARQLS